MKVALYRKFNHEMVILSVIFGFFLIIGIFDSVTELFWQTIKQVFITLKFHKMEIIITFLHVHFRHFC